MKLSKVFHVINAIVGTLGVLSLLAAWYAGTEGTVFGMNQGHLFTDATVLFLLAIWIQLGTMHHMMLEERGRNM